MRRFAALLAALFFTTTAEAGIYECTAWESTDNPLSRPLLLALIDQTMEWRVGRVQGRAEMIARGGDYLVYTDGDYLYMVYGLFTRGVEQVHQVNRLSFYRNAEIEVMRCIP